MATAYIYFTTDLTKPPDYFGEIQPLTYKKLDFGNCGKAEAYINAYIRRVLDNEYGTVTSTGLYVEIGYIGHNIDASGKTATYRYGSYLNLRNTIELSTDNFQTIHSSYVMETKTGKYNKKRNSDSYSYTVADYYWYSGSLRFYTPIRLRDGENVSFVGGGDYYPKSDTRDAIDVSKLIEIPFEDTVFQLRVKVEYQPYDTDRFIEDYSPPYIFAGYTNVLTLFAPFELTITPPETFYANGINVFDALIGAEYTSELSIEYAERYKITTRNLVVRNEKAPYITSGENTEHIYTVGPRHAFRKEEGYDFTWKLRAKLHRVDPSDPDYTITAAVGASEGTGEYLENDDKSYCQTSITFTDLNGYYDRYGVLLRNTDTIVRASIRLDLMYGAYATIACKKFGNSSNNVTKIYGGVESGDFSVDQQVPKTGTNITTTVTVMQEGDTSLAYSVYGLARKTFSADVLDYFVPSFPDLAIHRCDADGEVDDNGDHCRIEWSVAVMPINNQNSKVLVISHSNGTTAYDPLDNYRQSGILVVPASTESSYRIVFTLTDDLSSESRTLVLSSAGVVMDWLRGGKGISFGKVASRKMAVEVSEMWKFICYNLVLSNVDVSLWMKQIEARLKGVEQFDSNLGVYDQFQVNIYNDNELLDRQWVISGMDAWPPSETPTRESTKQYSYSFVGWALTNGATTDNPDAFKNITAYRNIYAAFASVLRAYRVEFYNGKTLLETVENVNYGTAANPASSTTPTGDGTFFAFLPQPTFIEENTKTYAAYYNRSLISDSWDEILEKCRRKTAGDTYKVGQYKPITLSNGTTVNARIMGIRQDEISGMNKAEITWMLESIIGDAVEMNTVANAIPIYHEITSKDVLTTTSSLYDSERVVGNGRIIRMSGRFKFTQTASEDWYVSLDNGGAGRSVKIYQDGELVYEKDGSERVLSGPTVSKTAGTESVIDFEFELVEPNVFPTYGPNIYMYTTTTAYHSNVKLLDYIGTKSYIERYENGTGATGGWEHSNLRASINENIPSLFPEIIVQSIKSVKKTTPTRVSEVMGPKDTKDATTYIDNVVTTDKFWVPSIKELFGARTEGLTECAEYGNAGSSLPASNYHYKWLRDSNGSNTNQTKNYMYGSYLYVSNSAVNVSREYNICFCT